MAHSMTVSCWSLSGKKDKGEARKAVGLARRGADSIWQQRHRFLPPRPPGEGPRPDPAGCPRDEVVMMRHRKRYLRRQT